tara:strand:+ start:2624 stop:3340 length:717 start_codon:yes stop_codon:yes gene_type:complete
MSITLVAINHSSNPKYWDPCLKQISKESNISYSQINLEQIWETTSNFNWDNHLLEIVQKNKTNKLVLITFGCGTLLLKYWLKLNQAFVAKTRLHAIFIDSPPLGSWQNDNPLEKYIKMDRATYATEVTQILRSQSASEEWILSLPSKANYLKSLLLEVYGKTQLLDDNQPLVPLLEEWHELNSVSLPVSPGSTLKLRRVSLENWLSLGLIAPSLPLFPTANLTINLQRLLANILCTPE